MAFQVKKVDADCLFNMPLFEHHLVIDTRCSEEYAAGHITTAVSLPAPSDAAELCDDAKEALLASFVVGLVEEGLSPENISPIVLYNGENSAGAEPLEPFTWWVVERLMQLKSNRPLQLATVNPAAPTGVTVLESGDDYEPVLEFSNRLRDFGEEIWIMDPPYDVFRNRYPFLCGDVQFDELVPMPHRITSSIFMGSRPFKVTLAESVRWLHELSITHVIVNTEQPLASQEGLAVLRCAVPDNQGGDMTSCFDASILYINEAVEQGTNVLVQVNGRSQSAAIIMAWLMSRQRLTFEAALKVLEDRCWKRIDTSLIFAEQLKARQLPQAIQTVPEDLS